MCAGVSSECSDQGRNMTPKEVFCSIELNGSAGGSDCKNLDLYLLVYRSKH